MSDREMHIRDDNALKDLNNAFEYAADSLLKIEESVESYFAGVKNALEQQLELLLKQLEQAQEELCAARESLSSCEASQTEDEDGNITPSCKWEASAVVEAEEKVAECQRKYEAGGKIVDNCQSEWETYHKQYTFLSPAGGHFFVDHASNKHTDESTETLKKIIEIEDRYQKSTFGNSSNSPIRDSELSHVRPENKPLTEDEQKYRREVITDQISREQSAPKVNANRVMACPCCGRPLAMCICSRKKENMEIITK